MSPAFDPNCFSIGDLAELGRESEGQDFCDPNYFPSDDELAELGLTPEMIDEAATDMARWERERQVRIARGQEHACVCCGCSESKACTTGHDPATLQPIHCVWATETLCSRCVR